MLYQSAALKEAIDDLEWPGSSIQITLQPDPPCVTFRGEGHGDLQVFFAFPFLSNHLYHYDHWPKSSLMQIDFTYHTNPDLLNAFQCDHEVAYKYGTPFLTCVNSIIIFVASTLIICCYAG